MWFERAASKHSLALHLHGRRSDVGNKVLVLAAEDYLAGNPAQDPDGPHYLSYYTDALDANGVGYDVYDVDRDGPHGAGSARRARATTTPSSGTRATTT